MVDHTVQRVRHETQRRRLQVLRVLQLTPGMRRVTLGGDELRGFVSAAADDHVKVFFPERPGGEPILPAGPPGTPLSAGAIAPISRDYTPRRFTVDRNELDLDFSLHGDGPAARWAAHAAAGQPLVIGGPRSSFVVSNDFDWYVLAGDDTALPAIGRRLEELPASARAFVFAEVESRSEELPLVSPAAVQIKWLHRDGAPAGQAERLSAALRAWAPPAGDGYCWIAGESSAARSVRQLLVVERGFDKRWVKAAGYWKRGASATHERIED